ncbi:MAG: 5-formyltetrahydrofolate cyclo-ligase [Lentisphaerae bacterium]|nr:5-formyltetrahydrofolate cyclo-ligase [Lentisphaerota bacterium]
MDHAEAKKLLRKEFIQKRMFLSAMERMVLSGAIANRIVALEEFAAAGMIAAYAADDYEVNLRGVIDFALRHNKPVALPFYDAEKKIYKLKMIRDFQRDMCTGKYNLLEPQAELPDALPPEDTLWLMPGVAFDSCGTRLGRGGGFYDRMLEDAPGCRIGVFYQCQYSSVLLPCSEHDQTLTMAVTEEKLYKF